MAYRNKAYVCFDGDTDIQYYNTLKMWRDNDNIDFSFYDAHDINTAYDTSQEESIKKQLRIRMANSNLFIILVGEHTKNLRKYVQWEIELAKKKDLPIIVVNLNRKKSMDSNLCPVAVRDSLSIHIPFKKNVIKYAMEHWPTEHKRHREKNEDKSFKYVKEFYDGLGL